MQASGIPRSEGSVGSVSYAIASGLKGIIAVGIPTEWGNPYQPQVVGSWIQYQKYFGGLLTDASGNLLDFGPLYVKNALDSGARLRVFRVTHMTDVTNITTVVGVKATGTVGNGTNGIDFQFPQTGYGGNRVNVAVAVNTTAGFDITVSVVGMGNVIPSTTYKGLLANGSNLAAANAALPWPLIKTIHGTPTAGSVQLSAGAETLGSIVDTDYIGDTGASTGMHALDNFSDFVKISFPSIALRTVDAALSSYVTSRLDCLGVLRTPIGVTGQVALDYRNGVNSFSSGPQAIANWQMLLTMGGLSVLSPVDNKTVLSISEIGYVLGAMSAKDNSAQPWSSFAGYERGRLMSASVLGTLYNLGTPARRTEADLAIEGGVIPVITHRTFGVTIWGDRTLDTSGDVFLRKAEVAELLIYTLRAVKPAIDIKLFNANDIDTWKSIFRSVNPIMATIQAGRGCWKYLYQGDQDISDVSQAVVNTPTNIDLGKYVFYLWVAPKVNMDYVGFAVEVTSSSVDFTQIQGQPNIL